MAAAAARAAATTRPAAGPAEAVDPRAAAQEAAARAATNPDSAIQSQSAIESAIRNPQSAMRKPRVAITSGDPAGIGPEVAARAAADRRVLDACEPVLYGPPPGATFAVGT